MRGLITDKGELRCRAAILAPGRVGADWMGDMAKKYGMELQQRGIEVGVRVETHNDVMSDLTNVIYDPPFCADAALRRPDAHVLHQPRRVHHA